MEIVSYVLPLTNSGVCTRVTRKRPSSARVVNRLWWKIPSSQTPLSELFIGASQVGGGQESQMQVIVKGMVQVAGTTFRIVRIQRGHYEVVRILDDTRLGSFWCEPRFAISESANAELLREVARCAIQGGKTTWAGRLDLTG